MGVGVSAASVSSSGITPFASNVKAIAVGIYSVGITVGRPEPVGKVHPVSKLMRMDNDSNRSEITIENFINAGSSN